MRSRRLKRLPEPPDHDLSPLLDLGIDEVGPWRAMDEADVKCLRTEHFVRAQRMTLDVSERSTIFRCRNCRKSAPAARRS